MKQFTIMAVIITLIPSYALAMGYHRVTFINNLPNETIRIYDLNNGACRMGPKEPLCPIMPGKTKSIVFLGTIVGFNTKTIGADFCSLKMEKIPQNITFAYSKKENYIDIFCDKQLIKTFENKPRRFPNK